MPQKIVVQLIFNHQSSHSLNDLFIKVDILRIFDIHRYQTGTFMYCWIRNTLLNIFKLFLSVPHERTHSHLTCGRNSPSTPAFRLTSSHHTICFAGPDPWNSLTTVIQNLSILSTDISEILFNEKT